MWMEHEGILYTGRWIIICVLKVCVLCMYGQRYRTQPCGMIQGKKETCKDRSRCGQILRQYGEMISIPICFL